MSRVAETLIFTDLDGSLLDHFSYSFAPAEPLLRRLEQLGIPVICCTSKTFAELQVLREQLNNRHPFVVENGAAVYIPQGYFSAPDVSRLPETRDGYRCMAFCQPRAHWQGLLRQLADEFAGSFASFQQLGVEGISAVTGLEPQQAALANRRDFSEPVQWLGDQDTKRNFVDQLETAGAKVLQGGRFMHVSGACDKGAALRWLAALYQQASGAQPQTIAIGDSGNDILMLEAADKALIIRSPVHQPPQLKRTDNCWLSDETGPTGWARGVSSLLDLDNA